MMYCRHAGNLLIKTSTHPLKWPLGTWMWRSELRSSFHLWHCILQKKHKKPSRQCDELSGRARGSCSEVWALHKQAERLRSVGIRGFELVARRHAGYAVDMEVARRTEGPEVNGM